jgi:tRNA-Thr(GGU) m(6)t(6)A37 methyltransferase TsaA
MNAEFPELNVRPVGRVRCNATEPGQLPIQGRLADPPLAGVVELEPGLADALDDVDGFEFVWLLWWADRSGDWQTKVVPYVDDRQRGLFATRAPSRPNPIGLTAVRVLGRDGATLRVEGLDMLDGTPVLDIKPYIPSADAMPDARAGWLSEKTHAGRRGDARFSEEEKP